MGGEGVVDGEERREEQKKGETAAERHIRKYELGRVELDLLPLHC